MKKENKKSKREEQYQELKKLMKEVSEKSGHIKARKEHNPLKLWGSFGQFLIFLAFSWCSLSFIRSLAGENEVLTIGSGILMIMCLIALLSAYMGKSLGNKLNEMHELSRYYQLTLAKDRDIGKIIDVLVSMQKLKETELSMADILKQGLELANKKQKQVKKKIKK